MLFGMMPGDGDGGGEDRKKPSGTGYPAVRPAEEKTAVVNHPMPVVLTIGTIVKLASVIMVPLLGILSGGIFFYHKTNTHIDDPVIHLSRDERPKLETKSEALKARKGLEDSIKREVRLQAREIKQDVVEEQRVQLKKLSADIKFEQKAWGDRLLSEVKQARRDIKGQ